MEREQANAIISLSRLPDWEHLMDYVSMAVREIDMSLSFVDPNDSLGIARSQGARMALANFGNLAEAAKDVIGGTNE